MYQKMTRRERILGALNFKEIDRIPVGMWLHWPHKDQDPKSLAEMQLEFARKYDLDFIKLMPFGLYGVQDWGVKVKFFCTSNQPAVVEEYAIKNAREWGEIKELPAYYGTYGKQVQLAEYVKKLLKDDRPFIQTIFSPLTTAKKLSGDRLFSDMRENPELLHQGLKVITDTTVNFIKANIDAGVDGFFFATQCSATDLMTEEEYDEFGVKYDLQLFDAYKAVTPFNVIHIHGNNIMFKKLAGYPGNCLNWHDSWVPPTIAEAKKITDKCILGGVDDREGMISKSTEEITEKIHDTIDITGKTGYIVGPECVARAETPETNFYAVRMAVESYCASR